MRDTEPRHVNLITGEEVPAPEPVPEGFTTGTDNVVFGYHARTVIQGQVVTNVLPKKEPK